MVPTTQSADLRKYYSKHTKNDRIDSELLARLPLLDFAELAEDIAHEAEQALFLTRQIKQIDERVANLYADADPAGIVASAPGVGAVISAVIALVPKVSQSGVSKVESSITKAGDPLLREMLCTAADQARRVDTQFAAKYQRLMVGDRHHESAICHLATHLVTRIAACMRAGQPYALRDVDGTPITEAEGRAIVTARYKIDPRRRDNVRYQRMRERRKHVAGQESQESRCAPTAQPAKTKPTSRQVA
nr:transposase [Rhodococcus sp. DK17]